MAMFFRRKTFGCTVGNLGGSELNIGVVPAETLSVRRAKVKRDVFLQLHLLDHIHQENAKSRLEMAHVLNVAINSLIL